MPVRSRPLYVGLRAAMTQLGMSARAFHRILKLARTIADLEGASEIHTHHLAEAIQYRPRGRLCALRLASSHSSSVDRTLQPVVPVT